MIPRMEPLSGIVNGVNRLFLSSVPYTPLTTTVFVRGLARVRLDEDGWVEQSPALGEVLLNEAPLPGDNQPLILYLDTTPVALETEVSTMTGTLSAVDRISGTLSAVDTLTGALEDC